MSGSPPTDSRAQLELEKLHLEVENLRHSLRPWYRTGSALVIALGGALALLTVYMQWRIAVLDVDRTEWKVAQVEEREREAIHSLGEKGREMAVVESQLARLQDEVVRRETHLRAKLEQAQHSVMVMQAERSNLEDQVAKGRSHLSGLQRDISRTEAARTQAEGKIKELSDEQAILKSEVEILDKRKTELLTSIMNDSAASPELRKIARAVVQEEYTRKKSAAINLFIKADYELAAGRRNSFTEQLIQRQEELEKEIHRMEEQWPWLPATTATPK